MSRKQKAAGKRPAKRRQCPFEEYGVTPEEIERTAKRELTAIGKERKAGKLKPWKPLPFTFAELIKEGRRR